MVRGSEEYELIRELLTAYQARSASVDETADAMVSILEAQRQGVEEAMGKLPVVFDASAAKMASEGQAEAAAGIRMCAKAARAFLADYFAVDNA